MEGIQLSVEQTGVRNSISVIKVGGYIDTTTSSELEHALSSLLKQGQYRIIIDLGNVDYVSSAGWGIFISEIKGIREKGGDLKLVRMIPEVYEVFELLEFHYILKAFDTIDAAIKDFERNLPAGETPPPRQPSQANRSTNASADDSAAAETSQTKESVEDKVRSIIKKDPEASLGQIAKRLNSAEYGYVKVGWFGIRRILKNLGLASKKARQEWAQ
jgi:anti-sigma B factor antagonist